MHRARDVSGDDCLVSGSLRAGVERGGGGRNLGRREVETWRSGGVNKSKGGGKWRSTVLYQKGGGLPQPSRREFGVRRGRPRLRDADRHAAVPKRGSHLTPLRHRSAIVCSGWEQYSGR